MWLSQFTAAIKGCINTTLRPKYLGRDENDWGTVHSAEHGMSFCAALSCVHTQSQFKHSYSLSTFSNYLLSTTNSPARTSHCLTLNDRRIKGTYVVPFLHYPSMRKSLKLFCEAVSEKKCLDHPLCRAKSYNVDRRGLKVKIKIKLYKKSLRIFCETVRP
jgi:hypothetical protein